MGHYDDAYEESYAAQRRAALIEMEKTIIKRLQKLADAMRTVGITGASVVDDAITVLDNRLN